MPSQEFWRNKRVLVAGQTAFKSSWMRLLLREHGAEVTHFALQPPTQPSVFEAAKVATGMRKSLIVDMREWQRLDQGLAETKPEIIVHMTAQSLARASHSEKLEYVIQRMYTFLGMPA